jgi:UDP-2,3-diacylglucosamine pyrophosphatase LpxH
MRTLIISDLHLGNGGPYDVFEGGEALPALLDSLGGPDLGVLVNGDGVDFLMNEDPLELDEARAVAQARAIAANPSSAAVLRAFGRVLARGGAVTIRLGNHDVELAIPAVQAVFREALGVGPEIAARLVFTDGNAPEILEVAGARVLVTHGEQNDDWNRVDYKKLSAMDPSYKYAPGSMLVKQILNLGVSKYGMRFLSLLKPDFQGAVLSAIAVEPTAAKELWKGSSVSMLQQLRHRSKNMAFTFDEGEAEGAEPDFGLGDRLEAAGLSTEEEEVLEALLDEGGALSFSEEDEGILARARAKIARAALSAYAGLQRKLTGAEGDAYFELEPTKAEWTEAERLAGKYKVSAVIIGHTHAARWKQDKGLLYANTGTWIGLMRLPSASAPDETWLAYLEELRKNKTLAPEKQKLATIDKRFTGVLVEPHEGGGAALSLVEWAKGELVTLQSARVPADA